MIQRPQTVYLALAFIGMVLMLVFPIYTVSATHELGVNEISFTAFGLESDLVPTIGYPFYLVYISLALISMAAIFSFKKRKRQLLIARLGLILHFITAIGIVLFYYLGQSVALVALTAIEMTEVSLAVSMGMGMYLLFISIPLYILAIKGIKRDENLVKSLDRLR